MLLSVDDLQYGADVTAAVLAHLATQLGPAPVLLVGATRTEGLRSLSSLTERSAPLLLEPLPPSAVAALAAAAGFTSRSAEVLERSQGHPLSVVASLQALASGNGGVPHTVATAVAGQLERLDTEVATLVAAASVLGTRVDPVQVAGLLQQTEVEVVLACERAVGAGLMAAAGTHYDFVNDLVKDAVLATLPPPLAVAYHRRAADLLAGRPEEMAGHAHAAGDVTRAAHGYLVAGRTARRMAALDDALALLDLAEADATAAADPGLTATVLLERARVQEARADFVAAHRDVEAARVPVADARDPRLDMRRLRLLGGDLSVGRRLPLDEVVEHNRTGLARATELGDAVSAAMFRSRIAVLECSRLRLAQALEIATDGVARSRASGLPEALARSLDGLKAVHAYSGDAGRSRPRWTSCCRCWTTSGCPGCVSGRCSSPRSCLPPTATGPEPGAASTRLSRSTGRRGTPPTRRTSWPSAGGWRGSRATSRRRGTTAGARWPSCHRRPIPGGTRRRSATSPRPCWSSDAPTTSPRCAPTACMRWDLRPAPPTACGAWHPAPR